MRFSARKSRSGKMHFALPLLLCASWTFCVLAQDAPKPEVSKEPLTDEQLAVYRVVIDNYMKGSRGSLNVSDTTYPLDLDGPFSGEDCTAGIQPEQHDARVPVVHTFNSTLSSSVVLVDSKQQEAKVKQSDPENLIKKAIDGHEPVTDDQVKHSVQTAFSVGLFSLSEILFDNGHRHAIVSYSFHCGMLCGNGGTSVLQKTGNKWKVKKTCSSWVS